MPKYINADELRKNIEVDKYGHITTTINEFRIAVELSVADVVEVVRCKDCEFWNLDRKSGLKGWCYCEVYKGYKEADGFCNCGERRESDE